MFDYDHFEFTTVKAKPRHARLFELIRQNNLMQRDLFSKDDANDQAVIHPAFTEQFIQMAQRSMRQKRRAARQAAAMAA